MKPVFMTYTKNDIINTSDFPTENFSVIQLPNFIGLVFMAQLPHLLCGVSAK